LPALLETGWRSASANQRGAATRRLRTGACWFIGPDSGGRMKVFISIDMEGVSGLVRWADVITAGMDYQRNRRLMTLDANAAVAGAFDGGAEAVVVEENHGVEELCDLVLDEIDPRCRVVRGAGRPTATTMAALDASIGVVLLVGHHARAGSRPGIMAHTVSYEQFRAVRVGGRDCGEPELFAIRAGELGVPVGLIAGDQVACAQLRERAPWAETVEVKRALSNVAADVIPPARARELIMPARGAPSSAHAPGRCSPTAANHRPTPSRSSCATNRAPKCATTSPACRSSSSPASARCAPPPPTWTSAFAASPTSVTRRCAG
jgi:D-amino peptidase